MSGAVVPALVAASGGSALLAGIYGHERKRDQAMRRSRVRLAVVFPLGMDADKATAGLRGLAGLPYTNELVLETVASEGEIAQAIWVPRGVVASVRAALVGAIPSVRLEESAPVADGQVTLAVRLSVPPACVLATDATESAARAVLAGMVLASEERLVLRWALAPGSAPALPRSQDPTDRERELARAWQRKTTGPGFNAMGLLLVQASPQRARMLAASVTNAVRGRAQITGVRFARTRRQTLAAMPRASRGGWLSPAELLALTNWPHGSDVAIPGLVVGASREVPVPRPVSREGRPLFVGRDISGERPVAPHPEAALRHVVIAGASGSGKSAMLVHGVLADVQAGHAGILVDPKADAIEAILRRLPERLTDRVVVLDPGDTTRPVPGVDVLRGGDLDVRADVLTRTLKSLVPDWGIRSENFGRLAIRTLSEVPGATVADISRIFADEPYRRAAVSRLADGFLIGAWQNYETLSPAAKIDVVQAPLARVQALLSRERVRAVLANPAPTIDVARLFAERKFILVAVSPGVLGEASGLISASIVFAAWSAIEARAAIPAEQRHHVSLYVDELATLTTGLPTNLELVAERARGLGASLTVALQTLSRVPEPTRSALVGNASTFLSFAAPSGDEAAAVARQVPGLTAQDIQSLGPYAVAGRVAAGSSGAPVVVTGRTEPLPPVIGASARIRDRSAARYGSPPPSELPQDSPSETDADSPTFGVRRRTS